jgi:hypothetical protein
MNDWLNAVISLYLEGSTFHSSDLPASYYYNQTNLYASHRIAEDLLC